MRTVPLTSKGTQAEVRDTAAEDGQGETRHSVTTAEGKRSVRPADRAVDGN